jgi:ubiquinone/menaquinone biosynthesis C-methylase UbiE
VKKVNDNFSAQASVYAQFRPGYPEDLFEFIYRHMASFDTAWDCATGNGQAAVHLSGRFRMVEATDISTAQLAAASPRPISTTGPAAPKHLPSRMPPLI